MSPPRPQNDPLATAVSQAAADLASRPESAELQARKLLAVAPRDPRVLLIQASAIRRQGDFNRALGVIQPLAAAFPKAATTQFEFGAVLAGLGRHADALRALKTAVSLNPELTEAWKALGDFHFLAGDTEAAEQAYLEQARAAVRNPALKGAALDIRHNRLDKAEAELRAYLLSRPADAEALAMMGELYLKQGRNADAATLLAEAVRIEPAQSGARFNLANALFQQKKAVDALSALAPLLTAQPRHPAYLNLKAACLALIDEHEEVNQIYEALLAVYDRQPRIWLNYGHSLRAVGRQDEAVSAYRRSIALAPGLGEAYWSLANLKVIRFSEDEEAAMRTQAQNPKLSDDDRIHLHYALGKALEDEKRYGASFEQYAAGAAVRLKAAPYDRSEISGLVACTKALLTPEFLAAREGAGAQDPAPIFILGLPRSGSTLIEQILASHSAVEGTMELPDIGHLAQELIAQSEGARDIQYPGRLQTLQPGALQSLGEDYIRRTRVHRKLGRRFFIDKMPNNFQHMALIHLVLPKAKIIDARRHPMGACFSAFKQHFDRGQDFSYDLEDLGAYYRDYVALMAHVDQVLPGRVHRVIYEDMVEDTETEIRRLLDYCGLPFEKSCLTFYETKRSVRTVSSEQVRRPIFREGLDQWRNYEPYLETLKTALGGTLDDWRGAPPQV